MSLTLRRVALIHNPFSGQVSSRRAAALRDAVSAFRFAGVQVESLQSNGPGTGAALARQCVSGGFDAVIACGGDGTVHEVLQGLAGSRVALGVIPLGTANALAADLGLAGDPAKAARKLLESHPVRIPSGRIHYHDREGNPASRYFLVAAGIGADALLMSRLDSRLKRRLGYFLYLIEGFRIWATEPFPLFAAAIGSGDAAAPARVEISQLLAVRVRSFGGVLNRLAPGASLYNPDLQLIAFKTRRRYHYFKFLLAALAGRQTFNGTVQLHQSSHVECRPCNGSRSRLYVEADGEVLGFLPVRLEVVPDALTLLVPPGVRP